MPSSQRGVPTCQPARPAAGIVTAVERAGVGHLDAERMACPGTGSVGIAPAVETRADNPSCVVQHMLDAHRVAVGGQVCGDAMVVEL